MKKIQECGYCNEEADLKEEEGIFMQQKEESEEKIFFHVDCFKKKVDEDEELTDEEKEGIIESIEEAEERAKDTDVEPDERLTLSDFLGKDPEEMEREIFNMALSKEDVSSLLKILSPQIREVARVHNEGSRLGMVQQPIKMNDVDLYHLAKILINIQKVAHQKGLCKKTPCRYQDDVERFKRQFSDYIERDNMPLEI